MEVDGQTLLKMSEKNIQDIDDFCIEEEDKEELWKAVCKLQSNGHEPPLVKDIDYNVERKVFHDAIHGSMEFHPLLVKIIDTPEFQRLRNIKQLGCASFVYPAACHQRFEHSLGVCHLAGQLLRKLKTNQPELEILERDILCVEIAGLCHDLGHGPFSHMFDGRFLPEARPKEKWRHEDFSVMMFDHLLNSNVPVQDAFKEYGLYNKSDLSFIKEQIQGLPRSRHANRAFLYEVVANKNNGIDVDKWDYFARDCHYLGIRNVFDHNRLMNFVRVLKVNGEPQICTRDKEAETLYDMFHTRRALHKRAYQHRVVTAVEAMLSDAFLLADAHLLYYNSKGEAKTLSQCIDDPEAYSMLTDHVYYEIRASRDENLRESRAIIERIERRDLYKCVGETRKISGEPLDRSQLPEMRDQIASCLTEEELEGTFPLNPNDLILNMVKLDYGMGQQNPVENVWFYMKGNPTQPIRIRKNEVSVMLPERFSEQILIMFCKRMDVEGIELAEKSFKKWCLDNNMVTPKIQTMLNMTQS